MGTKKKTEDAVADPADVITSPEEHAEAIADADLEGDVHVSSDELSNDEEIAARSADMDKPGGEHIKQFVLPDVNGRHSKSSGNPWTEANDFDHEPNKAATRQGAINAGLWPTGDAHYVSAKRHPDGTSWVLTYSVPVEPAHTFDADETPHPEVIGDDTDKGGASKAQNADASKSTEK